MVMVKATESTSFTKDVQGRYLCNDLSEVNAWQAFGGRPFDVIIVGGGTFGAAIAEHVWFRQKRAGGGLRTLVVEGGPYVLGEHAQNVGIQGFGDAPGTSILNDNAPQPEPAKNEVWGVPWKSATPFTGLAYCVGGRSLYWGGWSPRLLDEEVATWPPEVVNDLKAPYMDESARQIGVDATNDFIFGPLHQAMRQQLADGLGTVDAAIPLADLPPSPLLRGGEQRSDLLRLVGLTDPGAPPDDVLQGLLKLEAPLAVQARPPHAGFFPLNKFSTVPLVMKAARTAFYDVNGDDARKEFMLLPNTHVNGVRVVATASGTWRTTGVDTSSGFIELAPNGVVVIALGTIESARLALNSFRGTAIPTLPRMGRNLLAHVRSNLTIRVPRAAIADLVGGMGELQTAALFVKGRATAQGGRVLGTFHLQITATGGAQTVGAEDELYKKIPDVDFFEKLRTADDQTVAIAIRGIGQMAAADPANPDAHPSRVEPDPNRTDEYGVPRALVTITTTQDDIDLWTIMDRTMDQVAKLFAGNQPFQVVFDGGVTVNADVNTDLSQVSPYAPKSPQNPQNRRDGLGTTHHETGPLWMGTDPARSVTAPDGRLHFTENVHAAGPAIFPTIGSPNPMLTGIALARRTGDRIVTPPPFAPDNGFQSLFDGQGLGDWRMSTIRNQSGRDNPGTFVIRRGALESRPGTDLGLLWLNRPTPPRYVLRLEWMMTAPDDNSGVFVGFPNPEGEGYDNTAYVGVHLGFEVQIDELARPDGATIHRTAAIYALKGATDGPLVVHPIGEWNQYEITVDGADYTVALNGTVVNRFHFAGDPQAPRRGLASTPQEPRFIGLQTHTGRVLFRHLQWRAL
jgi:choline dehydrogenase-like flavoprotein